MGIVDSTNTIKERAFCPFFLFYILNLIFILEQLYNLVDKTASFLVKLQKVTSQSLHL